MDDVRQSVCFSSEFVIVSVVWEVTCHSSWKVISAYSQWTLQLSSSNLRHSCCLLVVFLWLLLLLSSPLVSLTRCLLLCMLCVVRRDGFDSVAFTTHCLCFIDCVYTLCLANFRSCRIRKTHRFFSHDSCIVWVNATQCVSLTNHCLFGLVSQYLSYIISIWFQSSLLHLDDIP